MDPLGANGSAHVDDGPLAAMDDLPLSPSPLSPSHSADRLDSGGGADPLAASVHASWRSSQMHGRPPPSYADSVLFAAPPPALPHPASSLGPLGTPLPPPPHTPAAVSPSTAVAAAETAAEPLPGDGSLKARPGSGLESVVGVRDPQTMKRADDGPLKATGGGTYVTYSVLSNATLPGYEPGVHAVQRRFRDFVALASRLAATRRGAFLPPRPDKALLEGQLVAPDKEFVAGRCAGLNKYLKRLAAHPELRLTPELSAFLQAEGDLQSSPAWVTLPPLATAAAAHGTSGEGDAMTMTMAPSGLGTSPARAAATAGAVLGRLLASLSQSVTAEMSHLTGADVRPGVFGAEDEPEAAAHRSEVAELERLVAAASVKAESLLQRTESWGNVTGELGMAMARLGTAAEAESARLAGHVTHNVTGNVTHHVMGNGTGDVMADAPRRAARTLRSAAAGAARAARSLRAAAGASATDLSALHDAHELLPCARAGLADRSEARAAVQALDADIGAKKRALARLEGEGGRALGGGAAAAAKAGEMRAAVSAAEAARAVAAAEYAAIRTRNLREVGRARAERAALFSGMLSGFARVQAAAAAQQAESWAAVVSELTQAIEGDSGKGAGS